MRTDLRVPALFTLLLLVGSPLLAQEPTPPPAPATFAVTFRTGPKWDSSLPPAEQPFFREHSENLRSLRAAGSILLGGRFADVGLVLVTAGSEAEARAMIERDPSVRNGTFLFEIHAFRPFFAGCVETNDSRAAGAKP